MGDSIGGSMIEKNDKAISFELLSSRRDNNLDSSLNQYNSSAIKLTQNHYVTQDNKVDDVPLTNLLEKTQATLREA